MDRIHVLHIVGWYPNIRIPHETPFIARHIDAVRPLCDNTVWHIDARPSTHWRWTQQTIRADRTLLFESGVHRWVFLESIATLLVLWAWFTRDRSKTYDVVNFHIAYPNCAHLGLLQRVLRLPIVITEHWSAYHSKFNNAKRGTHRIKRIFHHGVPVIVVSRALANDIAAFVGPPCPVFHVVDNAVDPLIFHPAPGHPFEEGTFFTIAGWRSPKRPDILLKAFALLLEKGRKAQLRIAGVGPQIPIIKTLIAELGIASRVQLLGQLDAEAVAVELRSAHALVHVSDYETYSAVCAEALCCGTPVIASAVGGIPEFVKPNMGVLVAENRDVLWAQVWHKAWDATLAFDRQAISETMTSRANAASVGQRYHEVLQHAVRSFRPS